LMISLSIDRLSTSQLFGGFFTGYLIWTFSEYLLHRTLFHWIAPFRWGPRLQFILHGVHHEFPNDCFRLVMPPALGIIISIPFMITFRVIFGPAWFGIIVAGFFFSYLVYDMIHYTTHHLKWKNQIFQKLKSHHMLHHFSPNHKNRKYGVSSTMWDRIFRTY
jgi:sterol desaturase/sphingolipid hydroxylase (fatty acid hydroxylase superfamily)